MASQSQFDQLLRQEIRNRGSRGGETDTQGARDAVARRLNVKSGKNPNPRTSTAYKPTPDQPRGGARKQGGGKGGGRNPSRPGKGPQSLPPDRPMPGGPMSVPNLNTPDSGGSGIWDWLLPILISGTGAGALSHMIRRGPGGETAAPDAAAAESPRQMSLTPDEQAIVDAQWEEQPRISGPDGAPQVTAQPGQKQLPAPLNNIDQFVQDGDLPTDGTRPPQIYPPKGENGRDMTAEELSLMRQRMYPSGGTGFNDLHPRIKTPGFYRGFK